MSKDLQNKQDDKKNEAQMRRQVWYLPNAVILEEVRSKRMVLSSILLICAVLLALVLWAGLTTIQESSTAIGEVEPVGQIQVVQHLEGGTLLKKYVRNGDQVKAGDPLVDLDPTAAAAELKQIKAKKLALQIDAARLEALLKGGEQDTLTWDHHKTVFKNKEDQAAFQKMLKEDQVLLKFQRLAQDDKRAVINDQITQRKREIDKLTQQEKLVATNLRLHQKELRMHERLVKSKYIAERDYLRSQREVNQAKRDLIAVREQLKQATSALNEAHHKMDELNSSLKEKAAHLLGEINTELLQVRQQLEKLEDRVKRTVITAPVNGFVKGLDGNVGTVVQSGGVILTIVPSGVKLQATIRIPVEDIGHVKAGDPVRVKVTTFDFSRYGVINGILDSISATTFLTDKGVPFYRGVVELSKEYVGSKQFRVMPGMTVQADIITGEKTILKYLLKPIDVTVRRGFTER